ncbi:hypothetical protein [Bathymodiolus platifrons methanotrophic gill symbiont]|uniref:hypothetical protein n=1 Tax=Bathymodiolus platifrons methanotrophic gill symbiont TaxID=113268 RepID=UPI00142DD18C|nr:hypothetical protein [Bathymodiolus platifrons methanotrophic gill symbiont]
MSFPYKKNIEKSMKKFYDSLCEKNKIKIITPLRLRFPDFKRQIFLKNQFVG